MTRSFLTLSLLIATSGAHAQATGNPAGLSPDTPGVEGGGPAANHANNQDKLFVRQAALGNRAEVELSKQAASKSGSQAIDAYANRMQKEHTSSGERLLKAGKPAKVDVPRDLDAEHQRKRDELAKLSGADYDKAYLSAQIQEHQKTANLLLWHLSYGQNAELLRYSADTLPTVLDHLEHAKREYETLTRTPPRK